MVHVAELKLVVVAEHGGLEGDGGGEVIEGQLLDIAGIAIALLQLLEGLEGSDVGRIDVAEVALIIFRSLVDRLWVFPFVLVIGVAEGEVRRVVRHRCLALDVHVRVREGDALGGDPLLREVADGVLLGRGYGGVKGIAEVDVAV